MKLLNYKFACLCDLLLHNCNNNKNGTIAHFFEIKENFFDLSALIYICLHSSSDSYVFLKQILKEHKCKFKIDKLLFKLILETFIKKYRQTNLLKVVVWNNLLIDQLNFVKKFKDQLWVLITKLTSLRKTILKSKF